MSKDHKQIINDFKGDIQEHILSLDIELKREHVLFLKEEREFRKKQIAFIQEQRDALAASENSSKKTHAISRSNFYANISLSFFTLGLFAFTVWIALSTKEIEQHTNIQADAAIIGNENTQENSKLQLRAYVVDTKGYHDTLSPNFTTYITVRNAGQTPAYYVSVYGSVFFLSVDQKAHGTINISSSDFCRREGGLGQGVIASGAESDTRLFKTYADGGPASAYKSDDIEEFKKGNRHIIVIGETCYKDIFGDEHFKRFCFAWNSLRDFETNDRGLCQFHNDSDPLLIKKVEKK